MKKLICALVLLAIVFIETDLNSSYMDKPFIPEYPCIIMKGPGIDYTLDSPGGEITAKYY